MTQPLTENEKQKILKRLLELKQQHQALNKTMTNLLSLPEINQLKVARFKKRTQQLKTKIVQLETLLIPDILA